MMNGSPQCGDCCFDGGWWSQCQLSACSQSTCTSSDAPADATWVENSDGNAECRRCYYNEDYDYHVLDGCVTQELCENVAGASWDLDCTEGRNATDPWISACCKVCGSDSVSLCTAEADCVGAGGAWCAGHEVCIDSFTWHSSGCPPMPCQDVHPSILGQLEERGYSWRACSTDGQ
jgi:hypothetical protein